VKLLSVLLVLTVSVAGVLACTMTAPGAAPDEGDAAPAKAAPAKPAPERKAAGHPEIEEDMKLVPCSQCHKMATPKVYKAWYASTHGIGNVKCYQCHGTYENFAKVPKVGKCATCHQGHVESRVKKVACWECHVAHRFRGHVAREVSK